MLTECPRPCWCPDCRQHQGPDGAQLLFYRGQWRVSVRESQAKDGSQQDLLHTTVNANFNTQMITLKMLR